MRRTAKWVLLGVLGLAVAVVSWAAFAFSQGWSEDAAFQKVKVGMTRREVAELAQGCENITGVIEADVYWREPRFWRLSKSLTVVYDQDGTVTKVHINNPLPDERSVWERIQERIQDEYEYHKRRLRRQ